MSQRKERLTIETLKSEKTPAKVLNYTIVAPGADSPLQRAYVLSLTIENKLNRLIAAVVK